MKSSEYGSEHSAGSKIRLAQRPQVLLDGGDAPLPEAPIQLDAEQLAQQDVALGSFGSAEEAFDAWRLAPLTLAVAFSPDGKQIASAGPDDGYAGNAAK